MARTDTLGNFLTDVAEAIRTKEGTAETIPASEFDTRISNLSGGGSEDLTEELTTYNTELEEQNVTLDDIVRTLRTKASGSSGNTPNVFTQEEEPETKEGLWLQTNKEYDYVTFDEINNNIRWKFDESRKKIPFNFYIGAGGIAGDDVYLFGGDGGKNTAYKYNIPSDTYTQLKNIPFQFSYSSATNIGTDFYLINPSNGALYKYDALTNTYTSRASRSMSSYGCKIVAVDNNTLFCFGGDGGIKKVHKYTISTNTWESVADIPYSFTYRTAKVVGTDIYITPNASSSTADNRLYKYDTINNTYTLIENAPETFVTGQVEDYYDGKGNIIYFDYRCYVDRYNIETDTWTKLPDVPYTFQNSNVVVQYKGQILVFGGNGSNTNVLSMTLIEPDFKDKSIIIDGSTTEETDQSFKLFNIDDSKVTNNISRYYFNDVAYCESNNTIDNTIPTYYGDGTQWIKFKN